MDIGKPATSSRLISLYQSILQCVLLLQGLDDNAFQGQMVVSLSIEGLLIFASACTQRALCTP